MNNFFILGMPRCRSLWLSHMFTYGNSFCFHEQLSMRYSLMKPTLTNIPNMDYVGSADTYPLLFNKELVGNSPLLLIHRPIDDVKSALNREFGYTKKLDNKHIVDNMYDKLNSIDTSNIMHVNFKDLNDSKTIQNIIRFVGAPISGFHIERTRNSVIRLDTKRDPEYAHNTLKQFLSGDY